MDFGMPYLLEMRSIRACCALAESLGLSFVELNANFPECSADALNPADLRRLSSQYGVYFTLHLEEDCDPFCFNTAVRGAWLRTVRQALETAVALQMPIVNMHFPHGVYITLPAEKVYLNARYAEDFRAMLADFRALCESVLLGTDTRLAIENTNGWQPHEQDAIALLLESPVFGLTLDIGHCHGMGDADEPFFRAHEDKLIHMHGHDALGRRDHLALGDGEIDLTARFAWAQARGARVVLETKTITALRVSCMMLPQFLT